MTILTCAIAEPAVGVAFRGCALCHSNLRRLDVVRKKSEFFRRSTVGLSKMGAHLFVGVSWLKDKLAPKVGNTKEVVCHS